ncbi:hypothetical protein ABMA28_011092 [Loxostege sticticalis]|uniref:Gag protein n=1 Tax=Loxostege sticticalis TaxID=481309 RepID=A0ABD0S670_LOXSC
MKTEETVDIGTQCENVVEMGGPLEFKTPHPLQWDSVGDMLTKWKNFKQQLSIYILASGLERVSEKRKSAILLNCIGEDGQNLYYNILKKTDETPKYEDLLKEFDNYFEPKQNEIINTFNFNRRNQEEGESFDSFYSEIRKLIKSCIYQEQENRMLRDRIVMGIRDKNIQRKLLENRNLTLDSALDQCRAAELSQEHIKIIQKQEDFFKVDAVSTQNPKAKYNTNSFPKFQKSSNYNKNFYHCKKCNREHGPRQCPAFGKTCSICNKLKCREIDFVPILLCHNFLRSPLSPLSRMAE